MEWYMLDKQLFLTADEDTSQVTLGWGYISL